MQESTAGKFHRALAWIMSWFADRDLWNVPPTSSRYSGLIPANFTTLPHLPVSSVMNLLKSAEVIGFGVTPSWINRSLILGSARAALIALFSWSMISMGVLRGAPRPAQPLAS